MSLQAAVQQGAAKAFVSGAHIATLVAGVLRLHGAALSWTVTRRGADAVGMPALH